MAGFNPMASSIGDLAAGAPQLQNDVQMDFPNLHVNPGDPVYAVNTMPTPWHNTSTHYNLLNENAESRAQLLQSEQQSSLINSRAEAVAELSLQRQLQASHTTQHVEHIVQLETDSNQQLRQHQN